MADLFEDRDAVVSDCGVYRYRLTRTWGTGGVPVFIMLNPSTADGAEDDATIRRCRRFARDWGYSGIVVVNLFAYRATDPSVMMGATDPVGPDNQDHVVTAAQRATGPVVCAWGVLGSFRRQDRTVLSWLEVAGVTPMVLALSRDGHPSHPLYLSAELRPRPLSVLLSAMPSRG